MNCLPIENLCENSRETLSKNDFFFPLRVKSNHALIQAHTPKSSSDRASEILLGAKILREIRNIPKFLITRKNELKFLKIAKISRNWKKADF